MPEIGFPLLELDRSLADYVALVLPALGATLAMVGIVFPITLLFGLPLALVLANTGRHGLFPHKPTHQVLSVIVNVGRSIPFLILMAAVIPLSRLIVGTSLGVPGAIVPLTLACIPTFTRLVESSLREVPRDVIEAGFASGGTRWQLIRKVQLPEALPGLVSNTTIGLINIVDGTAIAGAVGAGGLGYLALSYGYNRFDGTMMLICVAILVVIAQTIQLSGDALAVRLRKD
ncbi:MAG: methionine ABC transporter permease [Propionicimonas sp.]|uniref:methionine ABC transporter permease n=1 Tax=Propionicimonas sp. TaxID=1955623 RepID=UPI002B214C72|nr:methionine ABC transporter permease [Propionicimonas sp.]MEA4944838.1 methionine ABC transporter permease [Propionicimonas sp.]MEA5117608.1 methionine ABC transporter permease [Propionicimonas sp.]